MDEKSTKRPGQDSHGVVLVGRQNVEGLIMNY
jgi:hypothetical protein